MGLVDRALALFQPQRSQWPTITLDQYAELTSLVNFNNNQYLTGGLNQTLRGNAEEISGTFGGLVEQAYKSNAIVFACMLTRLQVFSQARFQFQHMERGKPGDLWGDASLDILEHPWPGGTTGDLLTRIITEADLAGNWFGTKRRGQIRRLRADWVTIVMGSENDPDVQAGDIDAEVLGYIYHPGGHHSGRDPEVLLREDVAHFAPIPDPLAWYRGMSWLTPIVREIMGDSAATSHKLRFFENGATPNMIVSLDKDVQKEAFDIWVASFKEKEPRGLDAYRTLYLGAGAVAQVVGKDLQQLDFKVTQGAGETRIAAAAGTHPVIVGLSEGLQGSSLNAGNFGSARRLMADKTLWHLWSNVSGSLETLIRPPSDSRLWVDADIPFLREDRKDAADIQLIKAQTMRQLADGGWEPESVVKAVQSEDMGLLKHSGKLSVQLQVPGSTPPKPEAAPVAPIPKRDEMLLGLLARSMDRPQPETHLHLDAGAISTNVSPAAVTFEEGAIRGGDTHIATPDVNVTVEPANVTIEDGAVQVTTPEVRNEITVEPTPIEVTVENTVEPTPIEVRNEVTVDPTPVTVEVQPTPVSITNEIPPQPKTTKTIKRDAKGAITHIEES